jgi:hypothetical protein
VPLGCGRARPRAGRAPPTTSCLRPHNPPPSPQIRGMHTILRDRTTNKNDFVFYADRLNRLIVEAGLGHLPFIERQARAGALGVARRGPRRHGARPPLPLLTRPSPAHSQPLPQPSPPLSHPHTSPTPAGDHADGRAVRGRRVCPQAVRRQHHPQRCGAWNPQGGVHGGMGACGPGPCHLRPRAAPPDCPPVSLSLSLSLSLSVFAARAQASRWRRPYARAARWAGAACRCLAASRPKALPFLLAPASRPLLTHSTPNPPPRPPAGRQNRQDPGGAPPRPRPADARGRTAGVGLWRQPHHAAGEAAAAGGGQRRCRRGMPPAPVALTHPTPTQPNPIPPRRT